MHNADAMVQSGGGKGRHGHVEQRGVSAQKASTLSQIEDLFLRLIALHGFFATTFQHRGRTRAKGLLSQPIGVHANTNCGEIGVVVVTAATRRVWNGCLCQWLARTNQIVYLDRNNHPHSNYAFGSKRLALKCIYTPQLKLCRKSW